MKFSDAFDSKPDNNVTPIRHRNDETEINLPVPKTAFKKETEKRLQAICARTTKPRKEVIEDAINAYYYGGNDMRLSIGEAIEAMRNVTASMTDDTRLFAQIRALNHLVHFILSSREEVEIRVQTDLKSVRALDKEYGPSRTAGPVSKSLLGYMSGRIAATQEILEEVHVLIRSLADKGEPL